MRIAAGLLVLISISAVLFNNCSNSAISTEILSSNNPIQQAKRTCFPGPGISGSPQTVEEVVTLINSLPMPVTVACFLEALDRPLDIYGVNSTGSAQPSPNAQNPRIFVNIGPLYISIVTAGIGKDLVEFSVMQSPTTSEKAELAFPITAPIPQTQPFDRILFASPVGSTTCAFCHPNEVQNKAYSFVSKAVRPNPFAKVPIEQIRQAYLACNPSVEPDRCKMFQGIFAFGTVREKEFPLTMPTAGM